MELLTTLRDQLITLWGRWSIAQRIGLSAATLLCIGLVLGTLVWATRDEYVVIASQLTPQRAAEMKGVLETAQISAEMNFSGSSISVPATKVSAARLALKDQLDPLVEENSSVGSGMFESPLEKEERRRRALEARLEKTIVSIRGVRSAQVHVSLPNPSPFVLEKTEATASIVIDIAPGGGFTTDAAENIMAIVSRAVEGLNRKNIALVDTNGRQFSTESGLGTSMSAQLEYQREIEAKLSRKAESLLTRWLGPDRASVEVTAEIDFQHKERTETLFDGESKVKRKETTENITQTGTVPLPVGTVGATSNVLPNANVGPGSNSGKYNRDLTDVEYDNSNTTERLTDLPGRILRLTVSAVVDPSADGESADGTAGSATAGSAGAAASSRDMAKIEDLIKQAVGFDLARGDEFSIVIDKLAPPGDVDTIPVAGFVWQQYESLIQSVSLGLTALVALTIALLLMKKMKPVVMTAPLEEPMSMADMLRLKTLSEQAKANPQVVANILAAWIGEGSVGETESIPVPKTAESPPRRKAA